MVVYQINSSALNNNFSNRNVSQMATMLGQWFLKIQFLSKAQNFMQFGPCSFVQISLEGGTNIF